MVENGSQLTGPYVQLPYKNSIWIIALSSQDCEEASDGQIWGKLHSTSQNFTSFSEKLCENQKKRLNKPQLSPLLWENEALCRLHSPLGQTRNHSPVRKPPILQDVGNLEQEMIVTQTLTSLSLTPCSLGWEMERLQNVETVLPGQVCTKSTPQMTTGQGRVWYILISLQDILFLPRSSLLRTNNTSPQ